MDNQTDFAQANQQQQGQMAQQVDFQRQQQGQQQGHGRGALVALAVVGILVGIGGAGFGVYGMTQNKTAAPANLKVKIEKSDGSIVELETDKIKKAEDGSTITITDSATTTKYIYLDGHNLGIKVPEQQKLQSLSYEYLRSVTNDAGPAYSILSVNGVSENIYEAQSAPIFLNSGHQVNPLGAIEICLKSFDYTGDEVNYCKGEPVFSNDEINIYYASPQAPTTMGGTEQKWEIATIKTISEWLSDKDNYITLE